MKDVYQIYQWVAVISVVVTQCCRGRIRDSRQKVREVFCSYINAVSSILSSCMFLHNRDDKVKKVSAREPTTARFSGLLINENFLYLKINYLWIWKKNNKKKNQTENTDIVISHFHDRLGLALSSFTSRPYH